MDLAIVLPTNDYSTLSEFFLSQIENLADAKDRVEILFNLQGMEADQVSNVRSICSKVGITTRIIERSYQISQRGHIPYNAMRQDAADLDPDAKYYCLLDDDMILLPDNPHSDESIGEQLIRCIDYLDQNPDCGSIVLDNSTDQDTERSDINAVSINYKCFVVNGLILRNVDHGRLLPEDTYNLVGRGEDMLAVAYRMSLGYYPAHMSYTSILHSENHSYRKKPGKVRPSNAELGWKKSDEIARENNYGYIHDHYNEEFRCVSGEFNVISSSRYYSARDTLRKELGLMNNHEILGFAVPTNEPEVAFQFLLRTIENLKEAAPISTFLFNFQKPWTDEQINEAVSLVESQGFEVRWSFNSYEVAGKGLVPFNQIRGDACKLMPNAKFFVLMDDDFSFLPRSASCMKTAGEQYVDCIKYMTEHPECGLILLKNRLDSDWIPKYYIAPAVSLANPYVTARGIILRNFDPASGLVVPNEALSLLGSDEEKVASSWRLYNGLYPAVLNYARTHHYENSIKKDDTAESSAGKVLAGEDMYAWNTQSILDANANKFIREHFYPEFKNRRWRPTAVVSPFTYWSAGGLDITEDEIRRNLTELVDFNNDANLSSILVYYNKEGNYV